MAFLSLGLQHDEPPTSSDQGKNEPVRDSLHSEKNPTPSNGNTSANGNGHSARNASSADEFEADKFEDELDSFEPQANSPAWISAAAQDLKTAAEHSNGNGAVAKSA